MKSYMKTESTFSNVEVTDTHCTVCCTWDIVFFCLDCEILADISTYMLAGKWQEITVEMFNVCLKIFEVTNTVAITKFVHQGAVYFSTVKCPAQ